MSEPLRLAFIADIHLKGSDLDLMTRCLKWVVLEIREYQVTHLVIAGDLFEKDQIGDRYRQTSAVLGVANDFLESLGEGVSTYIISGNHDKFGPGRDDAIQALRPKLAHNRSVLVSEPGQLLLPGELVQLTLLPWLYADAETWFQHILDHLVADVRHILVAHGQVRNCFMNGGAVCYDGGYILPRDFLDAFDYLVLGDFHRRQIVQPAGGYEGALSQQDFAEAGNPCGMEILTIDETTLTPTFLECPYAQRHFIVDIASEKETSKLVEEFLASRANVIRETFFDPSKMNEFSKVKAKYLHLENDPSTTRLLEILHPAVEKGLILDPRVVDDSGRARTSQPLQVGNNPEAALNFWIKEKETPEDKAERLHRLLPEIVAAAGDR